MPGLYPVKSLIRYGKERELSTNGDVHHHRFLWASCFLLCLFFSTHIPPDRMFHFSQGIVLNKLLHVLAYGMATALFFGTLPTESGWSRYVFVLVGLLVVATLDEVTQGWVGRIASLSDWLADLIGITGEGCSFMFPFIR